MSLLLVYFHQLILSCLLIFYQLMKFQPQAHAIAPCYRHYLAIAYRLICPLIP